MNIREPFRAGSFYDASPETCRRHAEQLLDAAELPDDLPDDPKGALAPHAGWAFSGRLAARAIKALAAAKPETLVLFGADHVGVAREGEVYDSGVWRTPMGDVEIDGALAAELISARSDCIRAYPQAHSHEHSLEVQVPLIRVAMPDCRIVPITVPPSPLAVTIGRAVAETIAAADADVRILGSTDLTHHGGHFGDWGGAAGEAGVEWTESNDRRLLGLIESMDAEAVVPEVDSRHNACGAGAIAATVAACRQLGAERGIVLEYTNSYRVLQAAHGSPRDDTTVGYAAVVLA